MRSPRAKVATLAALGATLALGVALPATADYAPSSTDVVGVGGETPQYDLDFIADGDVAGDAGYNAANNPNKLVSFDANADANGRGAYLNGSTLANPQALNPTIVLRSGTNPVQRPQSTTGGISAILADTGAVHQIDYVRSARLPTAAEQNTAQANGWGFLHVVQLGTDSIQVVAAKTTNAPAGLSAQQLIGIYSGTITNWSQVGGTAGTIVPLLPPGTSVINTTFLKDLKAANGGTAITLGSNVQTIEQNDPGAITAVGANAIAPFSSARLALFDSNYFHNPNVTFPGGAAIQSNIQPLTGTPTSGGAAYVSSIGHYILFRESDASSTRPWQPGSTKNWVQTLFSNPGGSAPYVARAATQALIAAAGTTPNYQDLGNKNSG